MRFRAIILMVVAVMLGGVAAYMVNNTVNQQASIVADQGQALRPAVVAAADLPVGTNLERIHLRIVDLPAEAYPENSFDTIESVLAVQPAVVVAAMSPGEIVLSSKLANGVARRGLTAKIPDGMRAVSIPVNEVRGVGGFVLPGDLVDVFHTTVIGRRDEMPVTRTLLQNIPVLGVDQLSSETEEDAVVVKVITLLASPEEAKTITLAQQVGELTLVLRNEGDAGVDTSNTVALTDLWSYGPQDFPLRSGTRPSAPASDSKPRTIQVIRGLEVNQENVEEGVETTTDTLASN